MTVFMGQRDQVCMCIYTLDGRQVKTHVVRSSTRYNQDHQPDDFGQVISTKMLLCG
jgi:hypothetical protein